LTCGSPGPQTKMKTPGPEEAGGFLPLSDRARFSRGICISQLSSASGPYFWSALEGVSSAPAFFDGASFFVRCSSFSLVLRTSRFFLWSRGEVVFSDLPTRLGPFLWLQCCKEIPPTSPILILQIRITRTLMGVSGPSAPPATTSTNYYPARQAGTCRIYSTAPSALLLAEAL